MKTVTLIAAVLSALTTKDDGLDYRAVHLRQCAYDSAGNPGP
ncbi:hypothetical protein ABK905_13230 [Acerihabitans sp. KWT182]|uniref:Uncharacterized protein n=1 Tax=Acerihabitans sp. KWT182 TaxID=3157919 RepID=A0AAU7QF39_9GAMM